MLRGGGGGGAGERQHADTAGIDLPPLPSSAAAGGGRGGAGAMAAAPPPQHARQQGSAAASEMKAPLLAEQEEEEEEGRGAPVSAAERSALGRFQVVGYLGYFNDLDNPTEGFQPFACFYPLFRRFFPRYWQFVCTKY